MNTKSLINQSASPAPQQAVSSEYLGGVLADGNRAGLLVYEEAPPLLSHASHPRSKLRRYSRLPIKLYLFLSMVFFFGFYIDNTYAGTCDQKNRHGSCLFSSEAAAPWSGRVAGHIEGHGAFGSKGGFGKVTVCVSDSPAIWTGSCQHIFEKQVGDGNDNVNEPYSHASFTYLHGLFYADDATWSRIVVSSATDEVQPPEPVDGGWSECSVSCGGGTRTCDNPSPANDGEDCVGSTSCNTQACVLGCGPAGGNTCDQPGQNACYGFTSINSSDCSNAGQKCCFIPGATPTPMPTPPPPGSPTPPPPPPPVQVNGVCGTRATTYSAGTTAYPNGSTYCSVGSPSSSPAFPQKDSPVSWSCLGINTGTPSSCTASVLVPTHTVTVSPEPVGGKIKSDSPNTAINCRGVCSSNYEEDALVVLKAVLASSYWQFNGWGGDCLSFGLNPRCSLTVTSPKNVSASFVPRKFIYKEF